LFQSLIVQPLTALLVRLDEMFAQLPLPAAVSSFALALISIAVIVKAVTYPLTRAQMRSMRRMQNLQPQMKEIQKKYKGDREALAQKQMELYKQHGVNPFGGCLPLVIQIPLLIGLYQAIIGLSAELSGERFLWIDDLAVPEPLPWSDPAGIPLLLILLVASQYAYQKFLTPPAASGDAQAEMMAQMTKFMPLLFGFFFVNMPAGVLLYYTAFNVVSLVQQWYINSRIESAPTPIQAIEDNPKDVPAPAAQEEVVANDGGKRRTRRTKKR
jgi:YidC/Oxa1 family membrane protein insertase